MAEALCDECGISKKTGNVDPLFVPKRPRNVRCNFCGRRFRVTEYHHPRKKGSGRTGSRITEIKQP